MSANDCSGNFETYLGNPMNILDAFPPEGHVQRLYCDGCGETLDLAYFDFHEDVSGIDISITGLPVLRCPACGHDHLPDRSRVAKSRSSSCTAKPLRRVRLRPM
jgi:hypothetical protein